MSQLVPTLSSAGWVESVEEKVDFLLSDFFTSDYSQSYFFFNDVSSITYLIQRYKDDITELSNKIQSTLNNYLGRYFDAVYANVQSNEDRAVDGKIDIMIEVAVEEKGKRYQLGKLVESNDGHIKKIVNLNITGSM